ncbi:MAG TPA: DUF2059 domain-containing protein [Kiritimatiellia bacterium]|nr:DUF2059 domain-containing protein [Kiritimatiellia bacterium]HRZ12365.1 DUF2059 domain-containing protein [Kiritimatiellia bacterium]HSA17877.1 DUF2059 domain-containing protein [Kiritimatiellia bacterium]
MKTWKLSALALILVLASNAAPAGPIAHRQLVEKLMDLFSVETMCQSAIDALVKQAVATEPGLAGSETAIRSFLSKQIGWEVLKPAVIELYMGELTEKELAEIVRFYESRTGRKFAALSPAISARVMEMVQERMKQAEPEWETLVGSLLQGAPQ